MEVIDRHIFQNKEEVIIETSLGLHRMDMIGFVQCLTQVPDGTIDSMPSNDFYFLRGSADWYKIEDFENHLYDLEDDEIILAIRQYMQFYGQEKKIEVIPKAA